MASKFQVGNTKDFKKPLTQRKYAVFFDKVTSRLRFTEDKLEEDCFNARLPESLRKHLTFYRLHCSYFLTLTILGASILYTKHRFDARELQFSVEDSIFNTVSFVTVTGLTTVRIADLSRADMMLVLILMTLGSPVFTSLLPLYVRRFYFHCYHRRYVKECMKEIDNYILGNGQMHVTPRFSSAKADPNEEDGDTRRDSDFSAATGLALPGKPLSFCSPRQSTEAARDSRLPSKLFFSCSPRQSTDLRHNSLASDYVPARLPSKEAQTISMDTIRAKTDIFDQQEDQILGKREPAKDEIGLHSWPGSVCPQSPCFNVMKTMEHQALVTLCWLVPTYLVVSQLVSFLLYLMFFSISSHAVKLLQDMGLNTTFFSFFTTVSAFTNSGITASDDGLVPFQNQYVVLVLYTLVSLMGNLIYPPCLRLLIWILHIFAIDSRKPVYRYLLNHPRRCYTHLFPFKHSVWLCLTVLGFSLLQLIFFCTLNWHSVALAGLDPLSKIMDGIFQSVSVRNSGGEVVVINELDITILVLYIFIMLIAVYPVTLLRQNSTEYEHTDLGIYHNHSEKLPDTSLAFQSRRLLAKDSVYLCVILFVICILERQKIHEDPLNFSVFNIMFEVVSAYGGVGMSVGYRCSLRNQLVPAGLAKPGPCEDVPFSFSGKWSPAGRIILAIVMLMGRQRGLPDDIDSAIKIPSFSDHPLPRSGYSTGGLAETSHMPSPAGSTSYVLEKTMGDLTF